MKVIVIGGGLAGLTAAVRLHDQGHTVHVYEKNDYIGGRSASAYNRQLNMELDLAQHVHLFCCRRYRALLARLGTDSWAPEQSPLHINVIDARTYPAAHAWHVLRAQRLPAPLHMARSFLRYRPLTMRERLQTARTVLKLRRTDRTPSSFQETTFAAWLRSQGESEASLQYFWNLFVTAALNASVHDVSAFWGLMLFQEAFKTRRSPEIGIARVPLSQLVIPVQQLLPAQGGSLQTGTVVRRIQVHDGRVHGIVLSDGTVVAADHVIVAVGHRDVNRLLPDAWRDLPFFSSLNKLPTRPIIDVHLGYSRRALPEGFPFGVLLHSPVQWLFGHNNGKRLAISISNPGELWNRTAEQITAKMVAELDRLFRCGKPDWAVVRRNRHATFSVAPGHDQYRRPQKTPVTGLYVAGDWTDTGWPATMEGAVISGERAADEVNRCSQ